MGQHYRDQHMHLGAGNGGGNNQLSPMIVNIRGVRQKAKEGLELTYFVIGFSRRKSRPIIPSRPATHQRGEQKNR